jgi:CRP-like cAMP-binding protein
MVASKKRGAPARDVNAILGVVDRLGLFEGLTAEDAAAVAGLCSLALFSSDEALFVAGELADKMFILIDGSVRVSRGEDDQLLGIVASGDTVGELSLLTGEPHSATARAEAPVMAAVVTRGHLDALIGKRPDIGLVLYRNLAIALGRKLQRTDLSLAGDR